MDFISALNQIPSGIYSLLGVVLGFGMTCARDWYSNRDKLFCSFESEIPYEGWEYDKTPKEGDSGKIIKMYNCGNKPLLIEDISIGYKKMPIDGVLTNPVAILPYQEKSCSITKQDYQVMCRWVENDLQGKVYIIAYTVDGERIRRELDIRILRLRYSVEM